jgi:ABC-type dipeptide/oligopeptide/nickel transport system permease subunit
MRRAAVVCGIAIVLALGMLLAYGLLQPVKWSTTVWVFAVGHGTHDVHLPPFPAFSTMDVFDADNNVRGTHFYLLGSDDGGRDMVALTARGALPSLTLVGLVVIARFAIGGLAGIAMGLGHGPVRWLSRGMSRWVIGFPYLALAIIVIHALTPRSRLLAFVIGMAVVGWRDVAEVVAERIEHVRSQPFALSARALGTTGLTFVRLHVVPHLRPALAVELPFQASAVLVLLAELGYLKVFLGGVIFLSEGERGDQAVQLVTQPELGQLLSNTYRYILLYQFEPVLVPALTIALAALAFELIGMGLRSRADRSAP